MLWNAAFMPLIKQYKSFSQSKPWTARLLLATLIILALVRASLPLGIKLGAASWLESQGVETSIGDIEISLLDGSFAINDVTGKNINGKSFSLGRLAVNWQWRPLLNQHAIVEQLGISSLKVDTAFFKNGDMDIAGIVIKSANDDKQEETPAQTGGTPWDATIKNINFSEIELCMQQYIDTDKPALDYCASLGGFEWTGDISFKPSTQQATALPLRVNGALNIQNIILHNNQLNLINKFN